VVVLGEEKLRHPDEEQLEQYSLGMLSPEAIPTFEQHVLICHVCQDRVAEMDASIQGMQAEARQVRVQEMRLRAKSGGRNAN
jgi:anti-sigma factor ChrR (cupin superfamily)